MTPPGNGSEHIECWEDWPKNFNSTDTSFILLVIMVTLAITANIMVMVTIFSTESLRKQVRDFAKLSSSWQFQLKLS